MQTHLYKLREGLYGGVDNDVCDISGAGEEHDSRGSDIILRLKEAIVPADFVVRYFLFHPQSGEAGSNGFLNDRYRPNRCLRRK
jgi:hypothetical protein